MALLYQPTGDLKLQEYSVSRVVEIDGSIRDVRLVAFVRSTMDLVLRLWAAARLVYGVLRVAYLSNAWWYPRVLVKGTKFVGTVTLLNMRLSWSVCW